MLGSSQHHVFQRFVVVQSALSKLQKPWHQGSHCSSTSPELWGSVFALGILFPDHQGSQTGELVGPTWVVPVPRLQMPMQNLALLLDVSSRKTRQHMKPLEAWVRAFPIHLPGLTPTQELKERAYAEVGGEEPRTKKTQDQTMYRYSCTGFPEKEKQTREDCSNTLFSWQAGSVAQNSKDVQVLKDLLQGSHSLDQRLQPINVMGSCIDASLQFLDLVLQILLVSANVQSLGVYQQLPDPSQESADFSEHLAHVVKDSSNLWPVLCLEIYHPRRSVPCGTPSPKMSSYSGQQ